MKGQTMKHLIVRAVLAGVLTAGILISGCSPRNNPNPNVNTGDTSTSASSTGSGTTGRSDVMTGTQAHPEVTASPSVLPSAAPYGKKKR